MYKRSCLLTHGFSSSLKKKKKFPTSVLLSIRWYVFHLLIADLINFALKLKSSHNQDNEHIFEIISA